MSEAATAPRKAGATTDGTVRRPSRGLLLATLLAAWLLWSGLYKPQLLAFGAVSCLLVFFLARRMGFFEAQVFALRMSGRLLRFWMWLAVQVVRSSIDVARCVLSPRLPISPRIVRFEATATHPVEQAILGNSITLTPGTLTFDLHDGVLQVHSLTEAGADELMNGEMDRRVAALRRA